MKNDKLPTESKSENKFRRLEWLLSSIAAINCIGVVIAFSFTNNTITIEGILSQWPFPLIYFIEIASLGIIGLVAVAKIQLNLKSNWSGVPWVCSGVLFAFVILGAWTIGLFLLPAMILFLVTGILVDKKTGGEIPLHLVYFVSAGIAQAALVFLTLFG